jgi:hypothetical protein
MKKTGLSLLILLIIFTAGSVAFASLQDFSGRWTNIDPNTRGVTILNIKVSGFHVIVQAWGKAHPADIDWGQVEATPYAPDVSFNLIANTQALLATYSNNFSKKFIIIRSAGNDRLTVDLYTTFTDNSGRSNYCASYTFARGSTPVIGGLATPRQLSPVNGKVFNRYPRQTMLQWEVVPGAAGYAVEVDYFSGDSWQSDQGRTYIIVPNLRNTSYTFDFVGAQPGQIGRASCRERV